MKDSTIKANVVMARRLRAYDTLLPWLESAGSLSQIVDVVLQTFAELFPDSRASFVEKMSADDEQISPQVLSWPMALGGAKVGILSLVAAEGASWTDEEKALGQEVASLAAILIRDLLDREKLCASEAMFREFAENFHSVFWMVEPNNDEILYVSPAYDQVWGQSRHILQHRPKAFLEAIVEEDRLRVIEALRQHFLGPSEKIYRIRHPNGAIRWIKDRSFPLRNEAGVTYRVVGIAEDITALREAQLRLEAAQAQVISNAKFVALGEMASGVAHEINNPLAVIQGMAIQMKESICRQGFDEARIVDGLQTIEKMSMRIAKIVKGLRTFSRSADWDPMASADLISIVRDTVAICESRMTTEGVSLELDLPSQEIPTFCRATEISQVLLNLLNNALDAVGDRRERWINVRIAVMDTIIQLVVEDSGGGVDSAIRERIFQPFFTTKEVGHGTGLGLSISKGIMEDHGGKLYLDDSVAHARFVAELPVGGGGKI